MTEFGIFISKKAEEDLRSIVDYFVNELRAPISAQKQIAKLKSTIFDLKKLPQRYNFVRDDYLEQKGIRMIPVDNYLIFFIVNSRNASVDIVRVLHSRRDWKNIL